LGRVFVAGSINMDVVATAERHPRVGETVAGKAVLSFPGGKGANQAVAAARLGASATLIGRVGKDAFGAELRTFLAAQGVDLTFVKDTAEAHTGTAIITVANAANTIVVVPGANAMVSANDVSGPVLAKGDVAVSQFEIPQTAITAFFRRARMVGAITILNPAPAMEIDADLLSLTKILVLNEIELGFFTGKQLTEHDDLAHFIEAAQSLARNERIVCVTLGRRGVLALVRHKPLIIPGREVNAVDTTGAGDCFVGALASSLARPSAMRDSLYSANLAASVSVQRMGAAPSMPTRADMEAALLAGFAD
jgi:ribokinase